MIYVVCKPTPMSAGVIPMKATAKLHELGQSLWLDNITRAMLDDGTLKRYIDELSITGLTSNPTIFDQAIGKSSTYDRAIRDRLGKAKSVEDLFFDLAVEDLTRAADLFRPIHDRTNGVDGWVSLEVSPLLAYDTKSTLAMAKDQHRHQGPQSLRHSLRQVPRIAVHGQHHARGHAEGVRRSRRGRRHPAAGWGRLREGAGGVRQGRHRRRCARGPAAGRGGEVVRQFLERPDRLHRGQELRDQEGELSGLLLRIPSSAGGAPAPAIAGSVPASATQPAWRPS